MAPAVRRPFLFTPLVAVLVVLSVVSLALAVDVAWVRWRIIDTPGFVSVIAKPLAADPEVKDALADELAGQVIGEGNFSRRLQELVPAPLKSSVGRFARDIEQGWRDQIRPTIRTQLDSPQFQDTWERANRAAHAQLITALSDEAVTRSVVLDLQPVLQAAVRDMGEVIETEFDTQPGLATAIFEGLANALPSGLGKISVDLGRVGPVERMLIRQADTLVIGLLITGGLAAAFAIALARRRGGVVALIGGGVVALSGATWWLVTTQVIDVGEQALAASGAPLSANMQIVLETQARLATDSFARWQAAAVGAGTVLILLGLFGQAALSNRSRRRATTARSNLQYPTGTWEPAVAPPYAAPAPAGSPYAAPYPSSAPAGSPYAAPYPSSAGSPYGAPPYAPQYAPSRPESPYAPAAGYPTSPPTAEPYGDRTAVMPAAPPPEARPQYRPLPPGEPTPPAGIPVVSAPSPGEARRGERDVPPPWRPRSD